MKLKLGSLTIEDIDTYVRVSIAMEPGRPDFVKCCAKECPSQIDVITLISEMRGFFPDRAVCQAAGRVAEEARENKFALYGRTK